jgi:hypothetical protein
MWLSIYLRPNIHQNGPKILGVNHGMKQNTTKCLDKFAEHDNKYGLHLF